MITSSIAFLEWDSSFFGRSIGSLCLSSLLQLDRELDLASDLGFDLVYVYSKEEIKLNRIKNFRLIDVGGQMTFVKSLLGTSDCDHHGNNNGIVESIRSDSSSDVIELAYLSGQLSRFRVDPWLPHGSFEELYKTWITKIIDQMPSTSIYACYEDGSAIGMITSQCIADVCSIGLLAVHSSFKGRGIASRLIKQVESQCLKQGVASLEVKTQLSNVNAQHLYLKNRFVEVHRTFLYHAHAITANESFHD